MRHSPKRTTSNRTIVTTIGNVTVPAWFQLRPGRRYTAIGLDEPVSKIARVLEVQAGG